MVRFAVRSGPWFAFTRQARVTPAVFVNYVPPDGWRLLDRLELAAPLSVRPLSIMFYR